MKELGWRPKASTPIDKEWRTAAARKTGRTSATASVEQVDGVDSKNAITDDDGEDEESETEDEFAQFQESQEQPSGRADDDEEDMTLWEGAKCTKDRDEEATTRRTGARHRHGHRSANNNTADQSYNTQQNAEGPMDTMGASAEHQQTEGLSDAKHGAQDSEVAKRKVKRDDRHRKRNNKRARE